MLDCLIVGDSIAVGTAIRLPSCVSYSQGGINSWQWNKKFGNKELSAKVAIISLGSNDHKHINTRAELLNVRSKIKANQVYWILPHGNLKASEVNIVNIQRLVEELATQNGDIVLPITRVQKDNIHPSDAGYKKIVESIK